MSDVAGPGEEPSAQVAGGDSEQNAVDRYEREGAWVVVARGEYDMQTLGPLTAALEKAADEHPKVVLETSGVRFADSMFLTMLVNIRRTTDLRVAAPTPQLQRVLELTGVDAVLPVRETVEDALSA